MNSKIDGGLCGPNNPVAREAKRISDTNDPEWIAAAERNEKLGKARYHIDATLKPIRYAMQRVEELGTRPEMVEKLTKIREELDALSTELSTEKFALMKRFVLPY